MVKIINKILHILFPLDIQNVFIKLMNYGYIITKLLFEYDNNIHC